VLSQESAATSDVPTKLPKEEESHPPIVVLGEVDGDRSWTVMTGALRGQRGAFMRVRVVQQIDVGRIVAFV